MKKLVLLCSLIIFNLSIIKAQTLYSPDKLIALNFSLLENGTPTYKLSYKGKDIIKKSKLGLELKNDDLRSTIKSHLCPIS